MPIYEFKCRSCSSKFEKLVSFSAIQKLQECPNCHSQDTQKLISSFATGSALPSGSSNASAGCGSNGRFT